MQGRIEATADAIATLASTPLITPEVFAEILKAIVANAARDRRAAGGGK